MSYLSFNEFNEKLNLAPIRKKLEIKLSSDDLEYGELFYRQFLYLIHKYKDTPIVPTELIDEYWHTHILDTLKYFKDCDMLFGYYIHHFPYLGQRGEADKAALAAQFDRSIELFRREFGSSPTTRTKRSNLSICSGACGGGRITVMERHSGLDLSNRPI